MARLLRFLHRRQMLYNRMLHHPLSGRCRCTPCLCSSWRTLPPWSPPGGRMTAGSPISSVAQSTSSQAGEPRAPAGAVPTQDDASAAVAVVQEVKASGTAATAPQRKKRTGEVALLEMLSGQMKRARTEPSAGGDAVHSNGTSVVMAPLPQPPFEGSVEVKTICNGTPSLGRSLVPLMSRAACGRDDCSLTARGQSGILCRSNSCFPFDCCAAVASVSRSLPCHTRSSPRIFGTSARAAVSGDPTAKMPGSDLHATYENWAGHFGRTSFAPNVFGNKFQDVFHRDRPRGRSTWRLRLNQEGQRFAKKGGQQNQRAERKSGGPHAAMMAFPWPCDVQLHCLHACVS